MWYMAQLIPQPVGSTGVDLLRKAPFAKNALEAGAVRSIESSSSSPPTDECSVISLDPCNHHPDALLLALTSLTLLFIRKIRSP